ncbi:MAG: acyl-[Lachnospiraceae bacterium]|nr:acyl-[acyl-carrier-protein] thioesterase [Lachnospiraceae bacterium]
MYSYQNRIRYSELDTEGYLKIESLLNYFQDCTTFHSEDIGRGVDYLKEKHTVWVLGSWQIVVDRYPKLGERVTVATAPYDFKGFMGYRNFLLTDESGQRLACANTLWTLIDTDSGRPVRPTEEMIAPYILEEKLDMEYAPRKIIVPGEPVKGESVIIRPHHLDTNHHVNNGQYVRIALDSLNKDCRIRQLRAEYKKQSYLNDVLTPYVSVSEDGIYVVVLKDEQDATVCVVEIQEN